MFLKQLNIKGLSIIYQHVSVSLVTLPSLYVNVGVRTRPAVMLSSANFVCCFKGVIHKLKLSVQLKGMTAMSA